MTKLENYEKCETYMGVIWVLQARGSDRGSDMGTALFLDLPLDTIFLGHEKANVEEFSRRLNYN